MSFVNMVPRHRNWESSDDMMAARMPAVTSPTMMGSLTRTPTVLARMAPLGIPDAKRPVAQMPMSTQGTQTMAMQMGCATTVSLKLFALFAVSQC